MSTLTPKNIEIGFDGKEWILTIKKNNRKKSAPILPKVKEILDSGIRVNYPFLALCKSTRQYILISDFKI